MIESTPSDPSDLPLVVGADDSQHLDRVARAHRVVGIGASAGGVTALKSLFSLIPADTGMAFVVVLHISPKHESHLAAILQSETLMSVQQVRTPLPIEPNHVYVNAPSYHLVVHGGTISPIAADPGKGARVPIDLLFRTLGESYRDRAVCIVLSGTGSDGAHGLVRVSKLGGVTIAQDPTEAQYDGMVRNAIATKAVDVVLPIKKMPDKLLSLEELVDDATDSHSMAASCLPDDSARSGTGSTYAPPSVLVDSNFDIVDVSSSGGRYLQFDGQEQSQSILKVVDQGLRPYVHEALVEARDGSRDATVSRTLDRDGVVVRVKVTVRPCEPLGVGGTYLVFFEEAPASL